MLPASNDCKEISSDGNEINQSASEAKIEMQKYDEKENTNEMNDMLRVRQNKKREILIEDKEESNIEIKEIGVGPETKEEDEMEL